MNNLDEQRPGYETVLSKSSLLVTKSEGLAHGRNGLGVRVKHTDYEECGKKLLGESFKPLSGAASFFEISKVLVLVTPDCATVLMETICSWKCDFIRTLRSYGEHKSFLVRSEGGPPKDCFFVGSELVMIQPAKDERRQKNDYAYFSGNNPSSAKSEGKGHSRIISSSAAAVENTEPVIKRRDSADGLMKMS